LEAPFTAQMMRNGISFTNWVTEMIALCIESSDPSDDDPYQLRFIQHKMHIEIKELAPPVRPDHTMDAYLHEVRNAEDSIRTVILAESPDDIAFNEWRNQPRRFIHPRLRGHYPPPGIYIPERLRGQDLYFAGLPYFYSPKAPDQSRPDVPTETPEPVVTLTPEELVHDAERQDDTPVAKIDDKDELLLQQPDEPEIAEIVKETPDDTGPGNGTHAVESRQTLTKSFHR
jgi:hypothetical protein